MTIHDNTTPNSYTHAGKTTLIARGWTAEMIKKHLPEPDKFLDNLHYRSGPKRGVWCWSTIFEMEADQPDQLQRNLEKRTLRKAKIAANPQKERVLSTKQQEKLRKYQSEQLCSQFENSIPTSLMRTLCGEIEAAANTSEPWSAVTAVLAAFPAIYHQKERPVTLLGIKLRELELGKNGLCSFVFYLRDAHGNEAALMDFLELDNSQTQNVASLKAINQSDAVVRAQRLLTTGIIIDKLQSMQKLVIQTAHNSLVKNLNNGIEKIND